MPKLIYLLLILFSIKNLSAQNKPLSSDPTKWTIEEMKRFAAMSPAEQEAMKKKMLQQAEGNLKQVAQKANITIDETVLPSFTIKPPVIDQKRLALIPVNPPTQTQLMQEIGKMELALQKSVGTQTQQQVEEFSSGKSAKELQAASIGSWMDNNPQAALLLGMKATQKDASDINGWNNLAALMNMVGLEHQAIPILQHCLSEKPNNSMLLNNMGQAYLGLGDLVQSKSFFKKCLTVDDMHPEANKAMGMIYLFEKDLAKALEHFQKELQVAQRRSTLAQLVKSGQRDKINLAALRKNKMQRNGINSRDFFSEISLDKFKIPDPPSSSKQTAKWKKENQSLLQSLAAENLFWMKASQFTKQEIEDDGKKYHGIYKDLVDELLRDLGKQYIPLLGIINEDDVPYLQQLHYDYLAKDKLIICPDDNGLSPEAYHTLCCNLKTPAIDELMNKHNSYVIPKIKQAQSNYKQYINGLIDIVQLDPSVSNKRMVYAAVGQYFTFLQTAIGSYLQLDPYSTCFNNNMSLEEALSLIESTRNVDLQCPSWLKIEVSLKLAKLKADCEGYNIEADVYKLITVGAEKKFKTGTSTLYVGAGIEGSWKGVAEGSIKQEFYIVFDNNNDFADIGMRGGGKGSLGGGMIEVELGYDFAMNSGFNGQATAKSPWIETYEKALNFVK
jgi:tetratricopeptide (TPR) repeat protein